MSSYHWHGSGKQLMVRPEMAPRVHFDAARLYDAWHAAHDVDVAADAPWHRLLLPHVQQRVPGADVLEIGCGRGGHALRLWQIGARRVVAADFSPIAVQKTSDFLASRGAGAVETRVEDITRMSFADRSFDVVISCETVEHVTDPARAVREMARVLRPSGSLLLSTPNYVSLAGLYRGYLHMRGDAYTEEGQPINHLVMGPRTSGWLRQAGLTIEHRLASGLYLPLPRREGPLPVPLRPRLRRLLRPFLQHSAFVARKEAAVRSPSDTNMGAAFPPSRCIRVLRVADVPGNHLGGVRLAIASTSALLADRGHVIDHRFSEDMPTPGPRRLRRLLVPLLLPLHVMKLNARGQAPDIVEVHEPLGAPYALARRLTGRRLPPMVAHSQGLEELGWRAQKARWRLRGVRGPLKSRVLVPVTLIAQAKIATRLADGVFVVSSQDREHLLREGMSSRRVHRVDNGVEQDLLTLRRQPATDDGSVLLLFVGTWIDRKGTPELAQAFARLYADHADVRLAVAGTGSRAGDVLSKFPAFVRGRVEVHESVDRGKLRELLGRADLFVLPSWFEGMPLSLLEAAAAGLPIVAADTCGIRDVLRPADPDRDGGRLVPPHDSGALHAALDELVRDATLREELGARARARAHGFTWAGSADALEQVYRASLDTR